jgi:hypothetical protein
MHVVDGRRTAGDVLDDRNRDVVQPYVLAQRLAAGVQFGDDVVAQVMDIERRRAGRRRGVGHGARRKPPLRIIAVGGAFGWIIGLERLREAAFTQAAMAPAATKGTQRLGPRVIPRQGFLDCGSGSF